MSQDIHAVLLCAQACVVFDQQGNIGKLLNDYVITQHASYQLLLSHAAGCRKVPKVPSGACICTCKPSVNLQTE